MKLTVEKLGRIEHADIDIRPLTIFIGPNGTNKTWTAYALYGLLRTFSNTATSSIQVTTRFLENDPAADQLRVALRGLLNTLQQEPPPARVEGRIRLAEKQGASAGTRFRAAELRRLLLLPEGTLSDAAVSCSFESNEFAARFSAMDVILERPLDRLTVRRVRAAGEGNDVETEADVVLTGPLSEERIIGFVARQTMAVLGDVIVFPAERKGLVAASQLLTGEISRVIAQPLADFVRLLQLARGMPAPIESERATTLGRLLARVAGGEIAFLPGEAGRQLVFRTSGGAVLPIAAASAFSRAVAGLSIYLQHFMSVDDVLVIDELEMNAHPQAQLALIEFVAALVQYGVRVVLTTHSPYIVDHLNNLMEAARLSPAAQEEIAPKFALGTTRALIPSEKVAVHAFEEESPTGRVTVRDVLNRESNLIDWSTFGRVSDKVANLYSDILEKSNTAKSS